MTLYSYVASRFEDGGRTGVPRFDSMLRKVFPEMVSVTFPGANIIVGGIRIGSASAFGAGDIVITDNHLSLDVPAEVRTIVVHHGRAATHYERDSAWRTDHTRSMVDLQGKMFGLPNRTFISPSAWVAEQFNDGSCVIPHWVDPIEPLPKSGKPKIIGDWRDNNKGAGIWRQLAARCPQFEFQPLNFKNDAGRRKQYGEASLYLCLSLSEGGSYSVCDAEAAELPIVTTNVGNYREFDDCEVICWENREDINPLVASICCKLNAGRRKPSFYKDYTFERWAALWRGVAA